MGTGTGLELEKTKNIGPDELHVIFDALFQSRGPQFWWPSETDFETIVGVILAQNVSWSGASRAVNNLKEAGLLDPEHLSRTSPDQIAPLIRSSRYYHQKADRILTFMKIFMDRWDGRLEMMAGEEMTFLRELLLDLKGFGPETVDSILLYALRKPVFVVDAYTRRVGSRLGWFESNISYQEMQNFFISRLGPDVPYYNEYHALIVKLASTVCKNRPICDLCPLKDLKQYSCSYRHLSPSD